MKKVVKFGGSSLANEEQFQKVGDIIRSEESRRYVVPSAPGKRFSADTKVTDLLYTCYGKAEAGEDFTDVLTEIKGRFYEIIKGLNLDLSLEEEFRQIEADFKAHAGNEYAASRGEFLNGKVMAAYLVKLAVILNLLDKCVYLLEKLRLILVNSECILLICKVNVDNLGCLSCALP